MFKVSPTPTTVPSLYVNVYDKLLHTIGPSVVPVELPATPLQEGVPFTNDEIEELIVPALTISKVNVTESPGFVRTIS